MSYGKYPSGQHLKQKSDWEGGLLDFVLGYGLQYQDLPDDTPHDVKMAFIALLAVKPYVDMINDWFESLPELEEED